MKSKAAVTRLAALAQPNRLAIFRLLVQRGPEGLCVGDIGAKMQIANATLSFHLKELLNAGLITSTQQGRFIFYAANFSAMDELIGYLTENCCEGVSCREQPRAIDCVTVPKISVKGN
ncbi:MAG TPA: metalloregulator ArsR/SmtB family transcription factor [Spongiibacteraceae bacterium]|jgi:DNA-binding transcriptional ArsR family regulator